VPSSWIVFHLTERCPRACRHCLREPGLPPADLPVALVERVLAQGKATHRANHVSLTGGEPALHPRLEAALDAVVSHGFGWHLVTGGARFDRVLALLDQDPRRARALTAVDVSLDGPDEATHDAIRGQGSWREALSAVAACRAREIPLVLQMTVHALNAERIDEMGLVAAQLGASRLSFAMAQATGSARDRELALSPAGWRAARDRIGRVRGMLRLEVTGGEGWELEQPFHACEALRGELLHVDPRGRLTLCCQHSGIPGGERGVVADLAEVTLVEAHRRLLEAGQRLQLEKLSAMEAGTLGEWDRFPCNWCMRRLGMPHWTDGGSAGARRGGGSA
jgi:MoaA/NifB/PqqE/SkfB family radical SAM enzyme